MPVQVQQRCRVEGPVRVPEGTAEVQVALCRFSVTRPNHVPGLGAISPASASFSSLSPFPPLSVVLPQPLRTATSHSGPFLLLFHTVSCSSRSPGPSVDPPGQSELWIVPPQTSQSQALGNLTFASLLLLPAHRGSPTKELGFLQTGSELSFFCGRFRLCGLVLQG